MPNHLIIYAVKCLSKVALWGMAIMLYAAVSLSYAQNSFAQYENEPNEFIFEVYLPPSWRISEAIFAYENNGKYYLPINELAEGFDFYVESETDNQFANGFAGSEENSFTLDYQRKELITKGEKTSLADDAVLISDFLATDDIYVQLEVLNQIWPVNMVIELSKLQIIVEAEEELPFVTRKKREEKKDIVESRRAKREARKELLPRRENPYQWFGKPVVDYQAIYNYDTEEDNIIASNIFSGVAQIGKMVADFSANFRINEDRELDRPDNVRLKFSRQSAGDEYLVPGVRRFEFGDVNLRQRELIANTENGRGVVISNDNRFRFNEFDTITIEGTGPPGWEIELYNNEELIDFSIVPENGQYFFEDVILNFGNNQVKLLFFGPQGQVREELRSFRAGGNMLSPGQMVYQAGFLDADREFILLDNEARTTPRGVVKNGELAYGVNRWLTVFGNYAELPESNDDYSYMTAGATVSTPFGIVEAEAYNEISGGNALDLSYLTDFLGVRANLGAAIYNDFESQDAGFDNNRKTFEAMSQFNKNIKLGTVPIGLRLNTIHTERITGEDLTTVDLAQSLTRGGLRLSHNISSNFRDFAHDTTTGGLTTTLREGPWQLRGSINYEIYPEEQLESFTSELRYRTENDFQAAVNVGHNFVTSDYNAGFQLGYDWQTVLTSLETNFERNQGWDIIFRATTSLNPYTPDGRYEFSSTQKRQYSPVQANVFLDKNYDGTFNEGDEPLEGARLRVGSGGSKNATDEDGQVILNASADKLTNFSLDQSSLEDPYYLPTNDGFSTVPARGSVVNAEFPIIETGSVEGTVFREDDSRVIPGLTLELIDANNEVVADTSSAFDGYYAFEFVRPGTYTIRAEASHGVTLLDNQFSIPPDDLYVFGNDLYVEASTLAVPAAPVTKEIYGPFVEDVSPAAGTPTQDVFGPFKQAKAEILPEPTATPEEQAVQAVEDAIQKDSMQKDTEPEIETAQAAPAQTQTKITPRFKPHNDNARLVLEIEDKAEFEVQPSADPNSLHILIKNAAWETQAPEKLSHAGMQYSYHAKMMDNGTMLTISSDNNIELVRSLKLGGNDEDQTRLLFDIN